MRARMALKLANIEVEMREISLRTKPVHMLQVSPKGTVPVLILQDGTVLDESLAIMNYAAKHDNAKSTALQALLYKPDRASQLIIQNDTEFKRALDAYKYPEKFLLKMQTQHRAKGELFLAVLEHLLEKNAYLLSENRSFADIAIFPFVRQFATVDDIWWETAPYPKLRAWLNALVDSVLFQSVMKKQPTYTE